MEEKMLKIQRFIKEYPNDFKELLAKKPYFIKTQEDEHFILLKYSQIHSDFSNELVRECRGIILDKKDWSIAKRGFNKFGNYGESYVPEIDWDSAVVQEKLDGSLITMFWNKYDNKWQIGTNGTINANNAGLMDNVYGIKNYYDLVMYTLDQMNISFKSIVEMVPKEFSIICEITSPINRIVVPYEDFILTHLATKHNETGKEIELIIGLPKPEKYPLTSLEECIKAAEILPFNKEGYVVVDKYLNRIKIKGLEYVKIHHLRGEGVVSDKKVLDLIRLNEQAEFLSYYGEYRKIFDKMEERYNKLLTVLKADLEQAEHIISTLDQNRKEYAEWAKTKKMPSILFSFYDGKIKTVEEGLDGLASEKLLRYL